MTTYLCSDCGKVFLHPATIRTGASTATIAANMSVSQPNDFFETRNCPYCKSLNFTERAEAEADYDDWAQVPHADVKAKLDLGWKVLSHTKDAAVMAKRSEQKVEIVRVSDHVEDVIKFLKDEKKKAEAAKQ